MNRKLFHGVFLSMFRSDPARRGSRAGRTPQTRKLSVESLEARQLLCASLCGHEELLNTAPVMSDCSAFMVQESDVVAEGPSSLTNIMDRQFEEAGQDPEHLTEDFVFNLSSNPSSTYTIYLDFNGHVARKTLWNPDGDVVTPAYDTDGNTSSFSNSELRDIYEVWLRVSEDYMPFNVNVTTKEPSVDDLAKTSNGDVKYGVRAAIGGSCYDWYNKGAGGVAWVGSFDWNSDTPAYIFPAQLYTAKNVAEAVSHEVGHTLGLGHDGNSNAGYHGGADGWAPIMGVGYGQPLTQWSKGEYVDANNQEDDLEKITSKGFDYRYDDHGDDINSATKLDFAATGVLGQGIIERNTDVDFFTFELAGQQSVITVGGITEVTNLDAIVSIYDANKQLVKTYDPMNTTSVSIDVSMFPAGKYYMSVSGTGLTVDGNMIYSDYASLGAYTIETSLSTDVADPYEPNETQVGAYRLGVITEQTTINAQIDPRSDNDYFNFSIGAGYSGVKLTIDYNSGSTLTLYANPKGEWEHATNNGSKSYYALTPQDSFYFRVSASNFQGATDYRVTITPLENPELTYVKLSSTKAKVGLPIKASLAYPGLTANYQWYRGTSDEDMTPIAGADSATYVPTQEDLGLVLKVVAEGYGNCKGTASATTEKVTAQTVWTVGSTSDAASSSPLTLRQALASAGAGDLIVFDKSLNGQTISVGSSLVVDKPITIDATGLEDGITLNGGGSVRLIDASASEYLSVRGLTFADAKADAGAAIFFGDGILDVQDSVFKNNAVTILGAAIYANGGELVITNSEFYGNKSTGAGTIDGGAVVTGSYASLEVYSSVFDGNTTERSGAAIRAFGELLVDGSYFINNVAAGDGGAIWAKDTVDVYNTVIADNKGGNYGGGLYAVNGFEVVNCTVVNNSVTYFGGGLYVENQEGSVYNSIVLLNSSNRASGADMEKDTDAKLYGYNNITSYTKWTEARDNKTYSKTKPLFTDLEGKDYSIPANSQAVDVGNNAYVEGTRDILRRARIYNSTVDIGAYEYQLAPTPNLTFSTPTGWDAEVVLGTAIDAVKNVETFKIGEDYYLRFNFVNDSEVAIETSFVARVFLDGSVVKTYSVVGLEEGGSKSYALKLGQLAAGEHSLRIVLDPGNDVEESNEKDNVFEKTFKVVDDDDYEPNDDIVSATELGTLVAETVLNAKAGAEQNQDWYSFTTTTLGTAESYIRLAYEHSASADLGIALYNSAGALIVNTLTGEGHKEISLNALNAGTYYVRVVNGVDSAASIPYALTIQPPAPPKADLAQAIPDGWSSPIAINTSADATSSAEAFYENQSYYANFSIGNNSPTPISGAFYVNAYVDDVLVQTFTVNKLGAYGQKSFSVELGRLTVGSHIVKIVLDAEGNVEEESRANNTFTQAFNVAGVDDKFEPNDTIGTAYNLGSLIEEQTLSLWAGSNQNEDWFRFSMPEPGTSAGRIVLSYEHVSDVADVDLFLYNALGEQIAYSNRATGSEMISLNDLPAGIYYIRAYNCCNVAQSIPYEMQLFPSTEAKANLKSVVPSTWTDSIIVAGASSSSTDAEAFFDGTNYYVRFAFTNDSSVAIENSYTVRCYLDDVNVKTFAVDSTPIGGSKSFSFSTGALSLGAHTIRVELDTDNVVDESNEFDNVYAKTILVQSGKDEYEPNDSFETAFDLGVLAGTSKYSLNAQGNQNEDWFKFTTVSEGFPTDMVQVLYEHTASVADLDLELYNAKGEVIEISSLVTGEESVSLSSLPIGEYYICVYNYYDKTLTVPYELTIAAPVYRTDTPSISAEAVSQTEIVVDLTPVDGATLYTVQYSTDLTFSDPITVTSVYADDISIEGLTQNTGYFFRAKAVSTERPESPWSEIVLVTTPALKKLPIPAVGVYRTPEKIELTWDAIDRAVGYQVEYKTAADRSYTVVATTDASFVLNGYERGVEYTFRVRAIGDTIYNANSDRRVVQVETQALKKLAIPTVTADAGADSIALSWDPVAGAVGYQIEYKADGARSYELVETTDTTYTIEGLEADTTYAIRVRAVADGVNAYTSDRRTFKAATESAGVELEAPVVSVTAVDPVSATLAWEQVLGAESYIVKLFSESGALLVSDTTADTTYRFDSLTPSTMYAVVVTPYAEDAVSAEDGSTEFVTLKQTKLRKPIADAQAEANAIVMSWLPVEGADGYTVRIKLADSKTYAYYEVDGTEFRFEGLDSGTDYVVAVRAKAASAANADSDHTSLAVTTDTAVVEAELEEEDMFAILAASLLE